MSLHGLQCALAELFTSAHARDCHAHDPQAFALRFDLGERDRAQLDALAATAVPAYSATLVRKRRSEALRLLPDTGAVLGHGFVSAFDAWAQRSPLPNGRGRYVRDARAFCGHVLAGKLSAEQRATVVRERRSLRPPRLRFFARW